MSEDTSIHEFTIEIPDTDLDDLIDRLARTRWPEGPGDDDWSRGVPRTYLRELADYWANGFDWRKQEEQLNAVPQFVTTIDGQPIHFLHVRSAEPDALPLILTHGWPSSPVEFLNVIGPLTDPRAHGGDPRNAFDVVIPSLPGYGFSTPVREAGWGNLFRVAQAWAELMRRLGYERYGAQGTDVGSGVTTLLPMVDPEHVLGIHLTGTAASFPFGPAIELDGLDTADRRKAEQFNQFQRDGIGYLHLQATRPQTLAYSLSDSPVGQLAWIVEKFREWTDPAAVLPEDAVNRDQLLTNVSIAWFTGAGASSAHATYEGMQVYRQLMDQQPGEAEHDQPPPGAPTGYAVFAADDTIRILADPRGHVDHWSEYGSGGHFPAMEVPDLLAGDVAAFFGPLR